MPFCDCFGICEGFEMRFDDSGGDDGGGGRWWWGGRAGGEGFKIGEVEPVFTTTVVRSGDDGSTIQVWMSLCGTGY